MREPIKATRYLAPACLLSLGLDVSFSRLLRYWIDSLSYHWTLLLGILQDWSRQLGIIYNLILSPSAWNGGDLLLLLLFLTFCLAAAELTRRLLGGHIEVFPAVSLFAFSYAILPQLLLALIFWPDGRGRITATNQLSLLALAILLQAVLLLLGKKLLRPKTPSAPIDGIGAWGYAFVLPAVLLGALALLSGLIRVDGADALGFHLPLAAKYRVTGSIATGPDLQFLYPANPELVIRWFLTTGNDRLANLVPFLSAVLCLAVFYKILLAIGHSRQAAVIASCCLAAVPMIPQLAAVAYTDICALMFLLLSVYYLFTWVNNGARDWVPLFCCGLAAGLAIGSKLTMLPGVALIVVGCLGALWRTIAHNRPPGTHAKPAPEPPARGRIRILLLAMLPGCFYWFLRNLVFYGSPFYPIEVLGLPGYPVEYVGVQNPDFYSRPWRILAYPWTEYNYTDFLYQGIGALFAAIVIPLAIWWPIHMACNWKIERCRFLRTFLYFLAAVILIYTLPQTLVVRYGILAIVIAFFLIGEAWSYLSSRGFRIVVALAYALMLAGLIQAFAGGVLYHMTLGLTHGAARYGIPTEVDRMPPAVILNAAGGEYTYGLMGIDYRHDVITFFRAATAEDAARFHARFIYLKAADLARFNAGLKLENVASSKSVYGEQFLLCRIGANPLLPGP